MERVHRLHAHLCSATMATEDAAAVVLSSVVDGVCVITLHRPERGNAYTNQMMVEYFNSLHAANRDPAVRAIVVTGTGAMFCVGADKDMLSGVSGNTRVPDDFDVAQCQALELDKPVIGAIQGPAAGLGMVTALMCDVRFGCAKTKFSTAFAKRGLIAEHGIAWVLPRVVGTARAMDLLVSSRVVGAAEAREMGLLNFLCASPEDCLRDAVAYAREAAAQCSPAALAEIKRQIYEDAGGVRADTTRAYALMQQSFRHPDFPEGVRSLVHKTAPAFKGLAAGRIREL